MTRLLVLGGGGMLGHKLWHRARLIARAPTLSSIASV
jgi:hypothetical protein